MVYCTCRLFSEGGRGRRGPPHLEYQVGICDNVEYTQGSGITFEGEKKEKKKRVTASWDEFEKGTDPRAYRKEKGFLLLRGRRKDKKRVRRKG